MSQTAKTSSSPLSRLLAAVIVLSIIGIISVPAVNAQVAANQLCMAAGQGAGCIGAFRTGGMPSNSGMPARGLNPGGSFLGGMFIGLAIGLAIDMMTNAAAKAAAQPQAIATSQRVQALQQVVDTQRRFQEEREHQLLAALRDASASRLADSTADMSFLEYEAAEAGRVFDRGAAVEPNTLWITRHDAWFSTRTYTSSEAAPSPAARPAPVTREPLDYSAESFQKVQCSGPVGPYGGQLCSFPNMKPPAIKIEPLTAANPAGSQVADLRGGGSTPRELGRGAPEAPISPRLPDQQVTQPDPSACSAAPALEGETFFVAAVRRRLVALQQARDDARTYPELLTTAFIEKAQVLPSLQGNTASMMLGAYKSFTSKLICDTVSMLTDVVVNQTRASEKSDAILQEAQHGLVDAMPGGKNIRLALTGRAEEALGNIGEEIRDSVYDLPKEVVKKNILPRRSPEWARDLGQDFVEAGDKWLVDPEYQHWLKEVRN